MSLTSAEISSASLKKQVVLSFGGCEIPNFSRSLWLTMTMNYFGFDPSCANVVFLCVPYIIIV